MRNHVAFCQFDLFKASQIVVIHYENLIMRILLAEDDASQAESIKDQLEMDGYSVDWVERGDHAILAVKQGRVS